MRRASRWQTALRLSDSRLQRLRGRTQSMKMQTGVFSTLAVLAAMGACTVTDEPPAPTGGAGTAGASSTMAGSSNASGAAGTNTGTGGAPTASCTNVTA